MDKPAKQFDYERAMLWGDRLRVLLNSDHISNGEITETLKEKGIFIGSSEKSDTVPLLSACLLTPGPLHSNSIAAGDMPLKLPHQNNRSQSSAYAYVL